jgi:hypothetical protein
MMTAALLQGRIFFGFAAGGVSLNDYWDCVSLPLMLQTNNTPHLQLLLRITALFTGL